MGVKVKLADAREVNDRQYKAGDIVEVTPGEARLLVALNAGVRVDDSTAVSDAAPVPDAVPGNADIPREVPAAGDAPATPETKRAARKG